MKKVSAIGFAAFYLLLTTGLYVCILHCTTDYLLGTYGKEINAHSEKSGKHEEKKKDCDKDENCSCCNEHGQYAVKENILISSKIYATAINIAIFHADIPGRLGSYKEVTAITWPHGNAPPSVLKQPLYISYRSLLI